MTAVCLVGATLVTQGLDASLISAPTAAGAATNTIVSIEFDDGYASQYQTRAMLAARGMHGTYYINSNPRPPGFDTMSWAQIHDLANDGNEIAGHTLDHADLVAVSTAEATRQVCDDRTALQAQGFTVTSFAYPYGHYNATIKNIVKNCGYSSGRGVDGIVTPEGCGGACPYAESIPPPDPYVLRTPQDTDQDTPLSELEGFVTQAEQHGGGWVQLTFHEICSAGPTCGYYSIPPAEFATLLDFIAARAANGTIVRTVGEVMTMGSDTAAPTSTIACNGAACSPSFYGAPVQVSLAATDNGGGSGVSVLRYTTDGTTPTKSGAGGTTYTGPFTVSATTTVMYRAYDNIGNAEAAKSQTVQIDTVAPASSIACNGSGCVFSWSRVPEQLTLAAIDTGGSGIAAIRYTTDGSDPTPTSALYSAPITATSPITVKYRAFDNALNAGPIGTWVAQIDAIAPVTSITCNSAPCSGGWQRGRVRVNLSGADAFGSGVAAIHYTIDGSAPTAGSPSYHAPFVLSSSATVRFFAVDYAGNAESVRSAQVRIDTTPPAFRMTSPSKHLRFAGIVVVAANATDAQSGIAKVNFYVDGRLVSSDSSPGYAFHWNTAHVPKHAHTLTLKAVDRAGNSTSRSVTVQAR